MYDYVLQLGFDKEAQTEVQEIRNHIRQNELLDRQRGWLPHITIDIYKCKDQELFIKRVEEVIFKLNSFEINLNSLDNFEDGTLFIKPTPQDYIKELKSNFDTSLSDFMIEKRKNKIYIPHVTLCTNNQLEMSYKIANQKFMPLVAKIIKLWLYNEKMELIKEWGLN